MSQGLILEAKNPETLKIRKILKNPKILKIPKIPKIPNMEF